MKEHKLSKNSNKSFGIVFFIFFTAMALLPIIRGESANIYLFIFGLVFLLLGLFKSKLLTPLNLAWMKLGLLLGKLISPIVMFIIYFTIVFPTSLLIKLFGKDVLNLKINKNLKTYWIQKKSEDTNMDNQF